MIFDPIFADIWNVWDNIAPPPPPHLWWWDCCSGVKRVRIISTRGAAAKVCNITARPSWAGEWWLGSCRMHNTEILTFQTCTSHPHSEYPLKIPNMPSSREYFPQILLANKEDELDYEILRNGVLIADTWWLTELVGNPGKFITKNNQRNSGGTLRQKETKRRQT